MSRPVAPKATGISTCSCPARAARSSREPCSVLGALLPGSCAASRGVSTTEASRATRGKPHALLSEVASSLSLSREAAARAPARSSSAEARTWRSCATRVKRHAARVGGARLVTAAAPRGTGSRRCTTARVGRAAKRTPACVAMPCAISPRFGGAPCAEHEPRWAPSRRRYSWHSAGPLPSLIARDGTAGGAAEARRCACGSSVRPARVCAPHAGDASGETAVATTSSARARCCRPTCCRTARCTRLAAHPAARACCACRVLLPLRKRHLYFSACRAS